MLKMKNDGAKISWKEYSLIPPILCHLPWPFLLHIFLGDGLRVTTYKIYASYIDEEQL